MNVKAEYNINEQSRIRQLRLWQDPVYRERMIHKIRLSRETLSYRIKQSISQKKRFQNPIERERNANLLRSLPRRSGEKSSGWKGGISTENEKGRKNRKFKEWRKSVFERDNYTCQDCDTRGGILHPHHIKEYAIYKELRYEISNGITLCIDCHKKRHSKKNKEVS